jgi:hypothetical protein
VKFSERFRSVLLDLMKRMPLTSEPVLADLAIINTVEEWQESVEARLSRETARIYLNAALACMNPGGQCEVVNEMLGRAGLSYRVQMLMEISVCVQHIVAEAREKGLLEVTDG